MVRIAKLTDYGVVIMAYLAKAPNKLFQAREIAAETSIAYPTVSKLLRKLTKFNLLRSSRGAEGGYQLALSPAKISVVDIIRTLEGPIAITECSLGDNYCDNTSHCSLRGPWIQINQVIANALESIRLSDLITPTGTLFSGQKEVRPLRSDQIPINLSGANHGNHGHIPS